MKEIQFLEENNIIFLYGAEKLLQRRFLALLEREYLNPMFMDFNFHRFEGQNTSLVSFMEACETHPLGDDKKVVLVKEVMEFIDHNDITKEFQGYLNHLPLHCKVIFTEEQVPINGRLGFIQYLKKQKGAVEFKKIQRHEFKTFVEEELKASGKTIEPVALHYFTETSKYFSYGGTTLLDDVYHELKKMMDYAGDQKITKEMVEVNQAFDEEETIFHFIDALTKKDTDEALRSYETLRDTHLFQILALLYRQVRLLLHTKVLLHQYKNEAEIQKILQVPPFVAKKLIQEQRGFTNRFLRDFYDYLAEVDIGLKTGRVSEHMIMEQIIFRFTKEKNKRKS